MALTGNEVAAVNQQRRNEELTQSPVGGVLSSGATAAGAAVTVATTLVAGGPPGLVLAGSVVAGMGIVDWFRKLGTSQVNENLEALGQATEDALNRVENFLKDHGTAIDEIKRRLGSEELRNAMAIASLQALRTTQQDRLKRLALILANGVKDDDLTSESTDDMMRAAVELQDADITLLGQIYTNQLSMMENQKYSPSDWSQNIGYRWVQDFQWLDSPQHLSSRASLARLQASGLITQVETNIVRNGLIAHQPFGLLSDGKKFYERLQKIATNAE
jgi:hypothetical protein